MPSDDTSKPTPRLVIPSGRADALDALRGLAILGMALSGMVPYGVLPSWMYHAQIPPPDHTFNPGLPGLTWVDLVFPFFLFSLGAAIPLALARRIDQGESSGRLLVHTGKRGLLLVAFALYDQHIEPYRLEAYPGTRAWLLALLGFALLFPALSRLPKIWPKTLAWGVRAAGWLGAALLLASLRYPETSAQGTRFSLQRSDIIILVLANVAVFGSLLWLVTRNNHLLRLGTLAVLLGMRLAHDAGGWMDSIWNWTPAPWIYRFPFLQYLFIVIPGTVVGDMLLAWLKTPRGEHAMQAGWSRLRVAVMFLAMLAINVWLLIGLHARWTTLAPVAAMTAGLLTLMLFRDPQSPTEVLMRRLFCWGLCWLALGLVFEPYEGGIRKDHATLSYYFVTTGMAILTTIALLALTVPRAAGRWLKLLIDNGQNPMIAYVGITCLIPPLLGLTGLDEVLLRLTPTPWLGFIRACFKTLLLALAVSVFTRRRIFWRV